MRGVAAIEPWWKRLLAALALLALTLLVLGSAALAVGLGDGYGNAQAWRAAKLAEQAPERLRTFRRQALRDIVLYVPIYLAAGVGYAALVVKGRRRRQIVLSLLAVGGVADLIETVLFRRTLTRLLDGASIGAVDRGTQITALFTGLKFAGLLAAGVLALWFATAGERRPVEHPTGVSGG
jgi:hypothetical protein